MSKPKAVICPYCGETQPASERCKNCGGLFEPLSLQATHNAMGPWFIRDPARPFQPGCSYETLVKLIERSQVNKMTLLRGPTTKQFWTIAKRVPGVAHLFGYCHACDASVDPGDHGCHVCGVPFGAFLDRNYLGLPEVRPLPWEADVDDAQQLSTADPASRGEALEWGRLSPGGARALSSFASDEELLTASSPGAPRHAGDADRPPGAAAASLLGSSRASLLAPAPHTSAPSTSPALAGDVVAGPTARALQRRLAQQQRTMQWLLVGMGLITLFAVLLTIRMLSAAGSGPAIGSPQTVPQSSPPPASSAEQPASPASAAQVPADAPTPRAASPEPSPSSSPPPALPEPVAPSPAEPPDRPAAPDPATDSPQYAEFQRALALLAKADQSDRPLTDRIRDADEAVQVLKNIRDRAPESEHPADLQPTLDKAEQQLERLRLGDFFP